MLKKLSTAPLWGFILLATPLLAIAQEAPQLPSPQAPHWHWPGPWHGPQFWWICPLMMLIMFLVFGAIFFFFRRSWGEQRHHWGSPWHMMDRTWGPPTHSALQILDERFARGEIQKDEYEDKKAAILSGGQQQVLNTGSTTLFMDGVNQWAGQARPIAFAASHAVLHWQHGRVVDASESSPQLWIVRVEGLIGGIKALFRYATKYPRII